MNILKYWEGNVLFLIYLGISVLVLLKHIGMTSKAEHQFFSYSDVISLNTSFIEAEPSWLM